MSLYELYLFSLYMNTTARYTPFLAEFYESCIPYSTFPIKLFYEPYNASSPL